MHSASQNIEIHKGCCHGIAASSKQCTVRLHTTCQYVRLVVDARLAHVDKSFESRSHASIGALGQAAP